MNKFLSISVSCRHCGQLRALLDPNAIPQQRCPRCSGPAEIEILGYGETRSKLPVCERWITETRRRPYGRGADWEGGEDAE